ncbi:phage-related baseplate assembly protein [Janthinobacterium sp. HH103]|uniref:type VI secretion system Vgr family protein n=1 Tax=unclassified Janthinobacterium TaxID=2610881 RepID=UPI0008749062|nr:MULTISPECIES: type VI secretion system Vgr family protein [unclassified Janthinobacterium]OEZ60228.1 phage-related baseplate assembly protein [Janthinobacterium sp. HH100]OEZ87532.1 phage-related baseplate assembly protein [Janthinobacterium sp. HH103]QOU72017.1 Phage late control gene D protein (GPD) [Janthinobacterium sp. HH102]
MDGDDSISGGERPLRLRLGVSPKVPAGALIPQRVAGSEAICGGIEYRVLCVSTHADLPLSSFIALPAAIDIVTDQGKLRSICGIVTQASAGDSDGALASYQLVLTDAFAIMEKRSNTRVFRRLTDIEIIKILLDEWIRSNSVLGHAFQYVFADFFEAQTYPQREFVMQHNESDAAFVRRLLKRSGVAWFFRAEGNADAHAEPAHTLVLFNHADGLRKNMADTVRYHADRATEQRDTLTSWNEVRKLQAGKVTRHSWNEEHPRARPFMTADAMGQGRQGMHGNAVAASLDDYRVLPPRAGSDHDALCQLGMLAMQQHDYESHCFHAEGSVRDLCPGEYFSLAEHPDIDALPPAERDFVVTALQVAAQNNLPRELAARVARLFARNRWLADDASLPQRELATAVDDGPLRMHIELSAVRRGVAIVPAYDTRIDLPPVTMQSAVVVGPANEEVHCDAMGRVKVRFPATRKVDHEHAGGTGASDTDADSAWVRVASSWAGSGPGSMQPCGYLGLPRVGSEVLLAFLGGDPDRPIIVGQLYNHSALPIALSKAGDLPGNRYLSGIQSREIKGTRGNQLRFDDVHGQINAQLASDHGSTQLNLGWLTQDRRNGQGEARGEGAELRTDEQLAMRAGKGMLISAWKRLNGDGGHMARSEYLGLMENCLELFRSLGSYAATNQALENTDEAQQELQHSLKSWEGGSNTQPRAELGGAAAIAVTAPAGISFASSKAIISYAAGSIDTVAQQHLQAVAGQRYSVNAGKGISLFAHADGIRAIAHHGKFLLQSQHDDMDLNAAKNLKLTASEGKLTGMADEIVLISKHGAFIRIGDGITFGSKSPLNFNAPNFVFNDPQSMAVQLPSFAEGKADQQFIFQYEGDDSPVDGVPPAPQLAPQVQFAVKLEDGSSADGRSDGDGKTEVLERAAMHLAAIEVFNNKD